MKRGDKETCKGAGRNSLTCLSLNGP